MAYEKTNWENGKLLINAERLNKMEEGISDAHNSYVVRLPADTQFKVTQNPGGNNELRVFPAESYDNFAEILYNGGQVMIDLSAIDLGTGFTFSSTSPTVWSMYGTALIGAVLAVDEQGGTTVYSFYFQNGTWTPPTV